MRYVQYMEQSADGLKLIETCGDRGVVILDQRNTLEHSIQDAACFNGHRRPLYPAFRIFEGESLMRAKPVTGIIFMRKSHILKPEEE